MIIDLVMISRFGQGDGGRETWLKNFLCEIEEKKIRCAFNLFSLTKSTDDITSLLKNKSAFINEEVEIGPGKGKLPISIIFLFKFFFKNFLKKKRSDHVIAVGGLEEALSVAASYLVRSVRGKKILWLRTIYTKEKGYLLNKRTQKLVLGFEIFLIKNFFDVVIANGEDTAQFYRGKGVECVVIANAINLDKWALVKTDKAYKTRIAFIGRLTVVKGFEAFIRSISIIKAKEIGEEIEFHVAGDGPLVHLVKDFQEKDLLKYHGNVPNDALPKILENIDCCVALTILENFAGGGGVSNALLEQMAAGKTIVAWRNNIFSNVLTSQTAYFVEQNNVVELSQTYEFLHRNKEDAMNRSSAAKAVSSQYSIGAHVEKFFHLIG